jgi:hypothetical protein
MDGLRSARSGGSKRLPGSRPRATGASSAGSIKVFRSLGGVAAVNRIDNLKTGIARGCGAWGKINEQYRIYAQIMGFHVDAFHTHNRDATQFG